MSRTWRERPAAMGESEITARCPDAQPKALHLEDKQEDYKPQPSLSILCEEQKASFPRKKKPPQITSHTPCTLHGGCLLLHQSISATGPCLGQVPGGVNERVLPLPAPLPPYAEVAEVGRCEQRFLGRAFCNKGPGPGLTLAGKSPPELNPAL